MPRYRIVKDLPEVLEYRGGHRLLLHLYTSVYGTNVLAYKKERPGAYSALILIRSPTNSAALVDAINAAGGRARLEKTTSLVEMQEAIDRQAIHFSVGDAVASSWIGNQVGFKGLDLDIAAATKPRQTAQAVAAFTLPA